MLIDTSYEFGDFVLDPYNRRLTYTDIPVNLTGKDFDILTYFVQNAGRLITEKELRGIIWPGRDTLHDRNLSTHISKIRKALNCDPLTPSFIRTHHGKRSYTFMAKVALVPSTKADAKAPSDKGRMLPIVSHFFSPVYLGPAAFKQSAGKIRESSRALYKEYAVDDARLCIFPSGIAVWHLTNEQAFPSADEVASYRSSVYKEVLTGDHRINIYNDQYAVAAENGPLKNVTGKPGYLLSLIVLRQSGHAPMSKLRSTLKALCCLTPLEGGRTTPNHEAFEAIQNSQDIVEFGSPGADLGFASWDGVAYLRRSDGKSTIENEIIDFELMLQAVWWLSKSIYDRCVIGASATTKSQLQPLVTELKRQHARLHGIIAIESLAQRTMIEAILKTSRVDGLVDDTLRIFEQI